MKVLFLLALFTQSLWARPIVLVGHFDPFGRAKVNNSTTVALELQKRLQNDPELDLRLCPLSTAFDKSFAELENCVRELPKEPKLIVGIGEAMCDLQIETMGRNLDHTMGPDNDGVERNRKPIEENGPSVAGIYAPVAHMYCGLSPQDQKGVVVSSNPGSFVCNNLIYQYVRAYPTELFSFIHVPTNTCRKLEQKNKINIPKIETMLKAGVKATTLGTVPTTKPELNLFRKGLSNKCHDLFYSKIKGSDERGFWK